MFNVSKHLLVDMLEGNGKRDFVSVIIPTYKRSEYLERAIESVVNQTYPYIEIIVVNDNNKDDIYTTSVHKIISKYRNIVLVEEDVHKNGAMARNNGLRRAKGEYIAFLDDDDYWDKEKIEKQVNLIKQLDDSYIAISTLKKFVLNNQIIRMTRPYKDGDVKDSVLYRDIEISTSTVLVKRSALHKIGGFDENLPRRQDIQLFVQLFRHGKLKLIEEHLTFMDVGDGINRKLSPEKMKDMEEKFFFSIKKELAEYPSYKRNGIKKIYSFESGICLFNLDYKIEGIRMCLPLLFYPNLMIKQILRKKKQMEEKLIYRGRKCLIR